MLMHHQTGSEAPKGMSLIHYLVDRPASSLQLHGGLARCALGLARCVHAGFICRPGWTASCLEFFQVPCASSLRASPGPSRSIHCTYCLSTSHSQVLQEAGTLRAELSVVRGALERESSQVERVRSEAKAAREEGKLAKSEAG